MHTYTIYCGMQCEVAAPPGLYSSHSAVFENIDSSQETLHTDIIH